MTSPDNIPGLFDDLIDNLDNALDLGESPLQTPPPTTSDGASADAPRHDEGKYAVCPQEQSVSDENFKDLPPSTAAPVGFLCLSEILRDTEYPERTYLVTHYEDAVRRGVVQAVVLEGHSFQVRYWDGDSSKRRTLQDELLMQTPELEEWLRLQRIESRYAHRAATNTLATSLARLHNGQDDFQRLAKLRRQHLNAKGKDKE